MQLPAPPVPGPLALLDTAEGFVKRKKTSLWLVGALLALSVLILTVGLVATTRTENVAVGGYYPGIILGFGSFLGIVGVSLGENRPQMLVAAVVFISFGVLAAFCCAVVDGVFAARHIVTCHSPHGECQLKVKSNTCYCCDLYTCYSAGRSPTYYEFVGVSGCQEVLHLLRLLWASAALNVLGLLLGVATAAVLGALRDAAPPAPLACSPPCPAQTLYNPAPQLLAYAGLCPLPTALPSCSSYPLPLQPAGPLPISPSIAPVLREDTFGSSRGPAPPSPPCSVPAHPLPWEKPPPLHTLTEDGGASLSLQTCCWADHKRRPAGSAMARSAARTGSPGWKCPVPRLLASPA